jgi:hypothetical protein
VTKEYIFKPCIKMVEYNPSRRFKVESIGIVDMKNTIHKQRPEKTHYFEYRDEHIRLLMDKEKKKDNKEFVKEEMRLMDRIGMAKGMNCSEVANHSLMKMSIPEARNTSLLWKSKEKEKEMKIKLEKDNFKRDEDYVKTLGQWERRTLSQLPKLK